MFSYMFMRNIFDTTGRRVYNGCHSPFATDRFYRCPKFMPGGYKSGKEKK
jgi:hypothetical protein